MINQPHRHLIDLRLGDLWIYRHQVMLSGTIKHLGVSRRTAAFSRANHLGLPANGNDLPDLSKKTEFLIRWPSV